MVNQLGNGIIGGKFASKSTTSGLRIVDAAVMPNNHLRQYNTDRNNSQIRV